MAKTFGYGRAQKLKSRKAIDALFAGGRRFAQFPLSVRYAFMPITTGGGKVQAGVAVSKKHFKRAVDRNRLKRLMREAYRLQQAPLATQAAENNLVVNVFFIYTDKDKCTFALMQEVMGHCLAQLQKKIVHENAG